MRTEHPRRTAVLALASVIALSILRAGTAAQALVSPCPGCGFPPEPVDARSHAGWTQIFDGRTLTGWDGNPAVWTVEGDAITAESTAERRIGSTFIIWRGGQPGDFELKLEMKAGADIHSGVFYRAAVGPAPPRTPGPGRGATGAAGTTPRPQPAVPADPRWNVVGYGLDFDYPLDNVGNVQDTARSETQIGWRGYVVRMESGQRPRAMAAIGDREAMKSLIRQGDWNQIHVIARGNTVTHIVNGQLMAVVVDDDPALRRPAGVIALQIEQFGTGRVSFRDIWLKQ
jgi:hypothetical protein